MNNPSFIDIGFLTSYIAIAGFFIKFYSDAKKSAAEQAERTKQIETNQKNIEKIQSNLVPLEVLDEMKAEVKALQEKMISREIFDDMKKRVDILSNQTEVMLATQSEIKTLFKLQEKTDNKIDHIDNKIDSLFIALNNNK